MVLALLAAALPPGGARHHPVKQDEAKALPLRVEHVEDDGSICRIADAVPSSVKISRTVVRNIESSSPINMAYGIPPVIQVLSG